MESSNRQQTSQEMVANLIISSLILKVMPLPQIITLMTSHLK